MRNITFSADADLIAAARARAASVGTTLNEEFRRWLTGYTSAAESAAADGLAEAAGLYAAAQTTPAAHRLLEDARQKAAASGSSLDEELHRWLLEYTAEERVARAMAVMDRIASYADSGGRKFTREEMNDRPGRRE